MSDNFKDRLKIAIIYTLLAVWLIYIGVSRGNCDAKGGKLVQGGGIKLVCVVEKK